MDPFRRHVHLDSISIVRFHSKLWERRLQRHKRHVDRDGITLHNRPLLAHLPRTGKVFNQNEESHTSIKAQVLMVLEIIPSCLWPRKPCNNPSPPQNPWPAECERPYHWNASVPFLWLGAPGRLVNLSAFGNGHPWLGEAWKKSP